MPSLEYFLLAVAVLGPICRALYIHVIRPPFSNVAGPPSGSFITGNLLQIFARDSWDFIKNLNDTYGPVARIRGMFQVPWLHVYDPKALHSMLVKDAESYSRGVVTTRQVPRPPSTDFRLTTSKQRKMLNPVFSGAHMRALTPVFGSIAAQLKAALEKRVRDGPAPLDMVGWMGRTALELVGQGGLGTSFDSLIDDRQDAYAEAIKGFSAANSEVRALRELLPYADYLGPMRFRRWLLDRLPIRSVQRVKNNFDIVSARCTALFNERKEALKRGDEDLLMKIGEGKDVMSVLLRENMLAAEDDKLPDDELLAQMATFIVAGTDTTSNGLARALHLLSEHQDVQRKLRDELREAHHRFGENISYDDLNRLSYLDAICRETLRLFAPVALTSREAMKDTILPLSDPIRGVDGRLITEIPIPKGTTLLVNLRACNTHKGLWGEDAEVWRPERWLEPLPQAVDDARIPGIYANLMTFLGGGYACIGFKFSQLEMKMVLYILLNAVKFEPGPREKPIIWNFAGISYPSTSAQSSTPEMYLNVSMAA
ncbi:cytochrome P450 [Epithele typhae]|uniref:cytochrome P450 n=1 Tax=Epithele typhae TaxID=378194 RepID=UPI002008DBC4|nr:cytochrome P450 [Epithele typhae]KAH9923711.1 cytochrome P450 [Epithele typhae]